MTSGGTSLGAESTALEVVEGLDLHGTRAVSSPERTQVSEWKRPGH